MDSQPLSFKKIFGLGCAAVVVILAVWLGGHINRVPQLSEGVKASWSQVLNQYQRRADLVPQLVKVVQGYASHERRIFTDVAEARGRVGQVTLPGDIMSNPEALEKFQKAQQQLSGALSRLLAVSENYPQLKASENFQTLQAQLEGTENRISVERRNYIEAVKALNIELQTIPGRWVAALLYPNAKPQPNFTPEDSSIKTPPQIDFEKE